MIVAAVPRWSSPRRDDKWEHPQNPSVKNLIETHKWIIRKSGQSSDLSHVMLVILVFPQSQHKMAIGRRSAANQPVTT